MAISVYIDFFSLLAANFVIVFIITGFPARVRGTRSSDDTGEARRSSASRTAVAVSVFTLILSLLFVFGTVPFLYQSIADFILVGLGVSALSLGRPETNRRRALSSVLLFLLVGASAAGFYGWYATVNNANYFNSLLHFRSGSTLFVNSSLPITKLPLVSEDYARTIASSHLSDFGGSVNLVDDEQIIHSGEPYWIFTVAPTNTFAENHELGFVLVDAVNGNYLELRSPNTVGPGLFLLNEINLQSYLSDTSIVVGNHYPTPAPTNNASAYYIFTRSQVRLDGVTTFNGGVVYAPDGTVVGTYDGLNSPSYVNQPWNKFLVAELAADWGGTRSGNGTFSLFAGGFFTIPASQFRLALSGDQELIPFKNGTAFMLFTIPANAPNSLAGVLLAYGSLFTYYDMQGMNFVSPDYAKATVQSKLPALSNGNLFAANPVLYPLGSRFIWIVPYYYNSGTGVVQLQGIAVMDASNAGNLVLQAAQGGIEQTRNLALASFSGANAGNQSKPQEVKGVIQSIVSYVLNGNTHVAISIAGTYYDATASNLPFDQWVLILQLKPGQTVDLLVKGQGITQISIVGP